MAAGTSFTPPPTHKLCLQILNINQVPCSNILARSISFPKNLQLQKFSEVMDKFLVTSVPKSTERLIFLTHTEVVLPHNKSLLTWLVYFTWKDLIDILLTKSFRHLMI